MKRIILALLLVLILTASFFAQSKQTANTLQLEVGKLGEKATIDEMKWLSGTWHGSGLGGTVEEIYSEPQDGVMMGMFRFLSKGKTVFYELITVAEEKESLIIRLKHFNRDLSGWEEKDKTVDFRFVKREKNRYYFEGMTFEAIDQQNLNIYLAIRQKDGTVREEIFRYRKKS
jgi:hypothetical protein